MNATHARNVLVAPASWAGRIALVVLGSLLLWASAKVQVPFWPVPMTMQTMVVLLLPAVMGRYGLAAVLLYVAEGAMGLPVFAGTPERGIGLAYLMGPTGGYIAGFVLAAALVAWAAEKGWLKRWPATLAVMLAGMALVYLPGVAWLAGFIGWSKAWAAGAVPFLLGDGLKLLLATALLAGARQVVRRRA